MQEETLYEDLRKALKISRNEPTTFLELITCIQEMEQEDIDASYKNIITRLWPKEWQAAKDKIGFETSKWNLLRKRRREINERLFNTNLWQSYYIQLTPEKAFRVIHDPAEIRRLRLEEFDNALQRSSKAEERDRLEKAIRRLQDHSDSPQSESPGIRKRRWPVTTALSLLPIVLIAFLILWYHHHKVVSIAARPSAREGQISIAVLPFHYLGEDRDSTYVADALTDEALAAFSSFPSFWVTSANSGKSYKDRNTDVKAIGSALGVDYVLNGTVRVANGKVFAYAWISDTIAGQFLMVQKWERPLGEFLELQADIIMECAVTLQQKAGVGDKARIFASGTRNFEAYAKLMRAYDLFIGGTTMDAFQAQQLCREAIALDADYAPAYALLADTYLVEVNEDRKGNDHLEQALTTLQQALTLDDKDPLVHNVLSRICWFKGERERAVREAEKAAIIGHNFTEVITWYGMVLAHTGKLDKAIEMFERSIELKPENSWLPRLFVGSIEATQAKYSIALKSLEKAAQMEPDSCEIKAYLVACYIALDQLADARVQTRRLLELDPTFTVEDFLDDNSETLRLVPLKNQELAELLRQAGFH